jgi:hypothetical protein
MASAEHFVFDELMAEAARVRDEVMPAYLALGPSGENAVRNMRRQLDGVMQTLLRREHDRARILAAALRAQHPPSEAVLKAAKPNELAAAAALAAESRASAPPRTATAVLAKARFRADGATWCAEAHQLNELAGMRIDVWCNVEWLGQWLWKDGAIAERKYGQRRLPDSVRTAVEAALRPQLGGAPQ